MKYLHLLLLLFPVGILAQNNVGIGTDTPQSKLDILATGDGAELLRFSTDRSWIFKQSGSGNGTALALQTLFDGKSFKILSPDGTNRTAEFYVNNTLSKVMLVPDDGTVGIGLTDPQAKLHIRHHSDAGSPHLRLTETADDFARIRMESEANPSVSWNIVGLADSSLTDAKVNFFYTGPNGSGDRLTITGGGNVGIGTSTPLSKLDIVGTGDGTELLRLSTENPWAFEQTGTGNGTGLTLRSFYDGRSFNIVSPDGMNTVAEFYAQNSESKVLLVQDAGKVGIGISDPQGKLHIRHDSDPGSPHLQLTEIGDDFTRIRMESEANPSVSWNIVGLADSSLTDAKINFFYTGPYGAGDRLTITGGGNVGIGTNTPTSKLHILNGNINVDNSGVALKVLGDEALWYNDSYFSWGFGGNYNYFNDPVKIGGDGGIAPIHELEVEGNIKATEGVYGEGSTVSVYGYNDTYIGVEGYSNGGDYGVYGRTEGSGTTARAVYGYAEASSGVNYGIYGHSSSPDGYAGYFAGRMHVTSDVTISGTLTVDDIPFGDYGNMQYNSSTGELYYDNSSRRFKENIKDLKTDFSKILLARPVQYTRPGRPDRIEVGYIAEEMEALGLDYLIGYDKDGQVENFNYEKMILYVVEVLKDQQKAISTQAKQLADQQKAIEAMQADLALLKHQ